MRQARGLLGLVLIWTGPAILLAGAIARSINITLAAGIVVVLAPLGGWLINGTRHSRQSAVAHRLARLQADATSPTDFWWLFVAIACGLGVLGIPWTGLRFWRREAEPLIESLTGAYRIVAYVCAGATVLIAGWLSISCSYLLIQGAWRRTSWGYRRQPPDTVESPVDEPVTMSGAQFAVSMACFAALALLLVGAMIVFAFRVDW